MRNKYNLLTEDEKQLCDMCYDWNMYDCNKCTFQDKQKLISLREKENNKTGDNIIFGGETAKICLDK